MQCCLTQLFLRLPCSPGLQFYQTSVLEYTHKDDPIVPWFRPKSTMQLNQVDHAIKPSVKTACACKSVFVFFKLLVATQIFLWTTRLHLISKKIQTVYAIIRLSDESYFLISFQLVSFPLWHFWRPDHLHSACKTVFDFADSAQQLHVWDLCRTPHVRNLIERCTIRGPRDGSASHHLWKWTGHTVL